jgi:hypothetical protein
MLPSVYLQRAYNINDATSRLNRCQGAGCHIPVEWRKITPKHPLAPGEYGLVALPKGNYLMPTRVFDFAIDPQAPRNTVVAPRAQESSFQQQPQTN